MKQLLQNAYIDVSVSSGNTLLGLLFIAK